MINKTKAKNAIELYTGDTFASVDIYEDPGVRDTYAIKAHRADGTWLDFLVVGYEPSWNVTKISEALEECNFETWPPQASKSGGGGSRMMAMVF